MDLTQGTSKQKNDRSKKMMLWFGIISLLMSFGGLTSAFIVSSKREDWLKDFELPNAFFVSLIVIILSSITLIIAKRALKQNNTKSATILVLVTLLLGLFFTYNQFQGFNQIIEAGYNFTGPTSNITMSYIFLIAFVHILHVAVGLLCLIVVLYNTTKQNYSANNMLGFELAANFWHFIDILWISLLGFLFYFK